MFAYSDPTGTGLLQQVGALQVYREAVDRLHQAFHAQRDSAFTLREAFDELSPGTQAETGTVEWKAFPVTAGAPPASIDSDRFRLQDEYVEWRVGEECRRFTGGRDIHHGAYGILRGARAGGCRGAQGRDQAAPSRSKSDQPGAVRGQLQPRRRKPARAGGPLHAPLAAQSLEQRRTRDSVSDTSIEHDGGIVRSAWRVRCSQECRSDRHVRQCGRCLRTGPQLGPRRLQHRARVGARQSFVRAAGSVRHPHPGPRSCRPLDGRWSARGHQRSRRQSRPLDDRAQWTPRGVQVSRRRASRWCEGPNGSATVHRTDRRRHGRACTERGAAELGPPRKRTGASPLLHKRGIPGRTTWIRKEPASPLPFSSLSPVPAGRRRRRFFRHGS